MCQLVAAANCARLGDRGSHAITLNLKHERGRALLFRMIERAEVLLIRRSRRQWRRLMGLLRSTWVTVRWSILAIQTRMRMMPSGRCGPLWR